MSVSSDVAHGRWSWWRIWPMLASCTRSDWAIRLLKLSRLKQPSSQRGLVMIQIDGLSLTQLQRALHKKQMPFLKSLMDKQRYVLRVFYSGMPSNTPAVQGELFYGVKGCVPAFCFMDRASGRTVRMDQPDAVVKVEDALKSQGRGLLEEGSCYSNIFEGGAREAHFCFADLGLRGIWHAANPLILPFLCLLYIDVFVRMCFLIVVELVFAVYEFVRAVFLSRPVAHEFKFVWIRLLISVVLREFCVAGVRMDVRRGLPVIHCNFLGYDEQAHCRGPSSAYAHWSLRGIDQAIAEIDQMIRKSDTRDYDLWIYSDHGQEQTLPFVASSGRSLQESVKELFHVAAVEAEVSFRYVRSKSGRTTGGQHQRNPDMPTEQALTDGSDVVVAAMGPVGHIYVKQALPDDQRDDLARRMVADLRIPLVMRVDAAGVVRAWTPSGEFVLPDHAADVFGADHPFLAEIGADTRAMCLHPDAGDWIIAGWSHAQTPITFPFEKGGHAGAGTDETRGFALLPLDAPVEADTKSYLRPQDLRRTAQNFLGRETDLSVSAREPEEQARKSLRVMIYNVHGCRGIDGVVSSERIARVIARYRPDVVGLQEIDVGRGRSGYLDQAEKIARHMDMSLHFHATFRQRDEHYGNAILSRHPLALIKKDALPALGAHSRFYESRGAMWVAVECQGFRINMINTHLSLWARERQMQVDALLGREWLGHPDCAGPTILCGDFNMSPQSPLYRQICRRLRDSQSFPGQKPHRTWGLAGQALRRIDYVFVSPEFDVQAARVPQRFADRIASDHLPLIVDLNLSSGGS